MSRILAMAAVAGLALALGGCGGGDDTGSAEDPAPTTSTPTPSPTNTGPLPPDLPSTPPPKGDRADESFTGTVAAGVEEGCVLVNAGARQYLLLGGADVAALRPGQQVQVAGRLEPDRLTTCQQGVPLVVSSVVVVPEG